MEIWERKLVFLIDLVNKQISRQNSCSFGGFFPPKNVLFESTKANTVQFRTQASLEVTINLHKHLSVGFQTFCHRLWLALSSCRSKVLTGKALSPLFSSPCSVGIF